MKKRVFLGKHAQVTAFIIIALMIIACVILLLFFIKRSPVVKQTDFKSPQAYMESCTREALFEAVNRISSNGGDIIPKGSVLFNSSEITYLCYTSNYYEKCINQRPILIEHMENEIKEYIDPKIEECFNNLFSNLRQEYSVDTTNEKNVIVKIRPKEISVNINREIILKKGEESNKLKEFSTVISHPLYDLGKIAMEIVNQESHYCNFDNLGYMIIYPQYDIKKFKTGDSDIIYNINDRSTGESFRFAIRSCVIPAGI